MPDVTGNTVSSDQGARRLSPRGVLLRGPRRVHGRNPRVRPRVGRGRRADPGGAERGEDRRARGASSATTPTASCSPTWMRSGSNPARIIPAWQDFLAAHAERRSARCAGSASRSGRAGAPTELAECQRHEALLNVAFADPAFWLLCPYDTAALGEARRRGSAPQPSRSCENTREPGRARAFRASTRSPARSTSHFPIRRPTQRSSTFEERDLADSAHARRRLSHSRAGLTRGTGGGARPRGARSGREQHRARPRPGHAGRVARRDCRRVRGARRRPRRGSRSSVARAPD